MTAVQLPEELWPLESAIDSTIGEFRDDLAMVGRMRSVEAGGRWDSYWEGRQVSVGFILACLERLDAVLHQLGGRRVT